MLHKRSDYLKYIDFIVGNINKLIVDDHLLIRAGMKLLLKNTSAYTVTAEAESGEEALRLLAVQPIDLVIMDISMPGMGGLACIREIRAHYLLR